jgi:hypothetical protein
VTVVGCKAMLDVIRIILLIMVLGNFLSAFFLNHDIVLPRRFVTLILGFL